MKAMKHGFAKFWFWFAAVALLSFAMLNGYWYCRSTWYVPVVEDVRLDRAGSSVAFHSWFDSVTYRAGMNLAPPFMTSSSWILDDATERRVWADLQPVTIQLTISDSAGRVVLREQSRLAKEDRWILMNSGSLNSRSNASVSKGLKFKPHRFETYSGRFTVLTPSAAAANYRPQFFLASRSFMQRVAAVIQNTALFAAWMSAAITAGVAQLVIAFSRRASRPAPLR
jgi:hypothetical protein